MARIEWVHERLLNWARWRAAGHGNGMLGYAQVKMETQGGQREGYRTATVPILNVEASETEQGVEQLYPGGMRLTVVEFYCGKGGHVDHARVLCCSVPAMYARVDQAHQQLAEFFRQRRDQRQAERARVEALQQRTFPR